MASVHSTRLPSRPAPAALAPLVQAHYRCSTRLALAIAAGALGSRIETLSLARQYRLITTIDTTEARRKGLLQ